MGLGLWALGFGVLVLVGCRPEVVPQTTGLPAMVDTECQSVQSHELGPAASVFSCRGGLLEARGALVGGIKGAGDGAYTLFSVDEKGGLVATLETSHRGGRLVLVGTSRGLMAISGQGQQVKASTHTTTLSGDTAQANLVLGQGEVLEVAATAYVGRFSREGEVEGVLVAASTGHGVRVWLVDLDGEVLVERTVLEHPEMKHCRRLSWSGGQGVSEVVLRCKDVRPLPPKMGEDVAKVRGFKYDELNPGSTDLRVTLDFKVRPVGVRSSSSEAPGPPERYEVQQYLREQLPRPEGQRVHVVDGVKIGGVRHVSLTCQGSDEGPAVIDVSLVRCEPRPEPEDAAPP